MKIVIPSQGEKAYKIAAEEFQRIYLASTGNTLEFADNCPDGEDAVVIGSDIANDFVRDGFLKNRIQAFPIRYGTDDYCLLSEKNGKRTLLFIAGGRGRSTLYAVYDFFERRAGCAYFWDGDVIPQRKNIDITGLHVIESPRFEYRGTRYFAHRGLWRFQAEHWNLDDWKREIDWLCKKRLNLFMLRIGMDDIFQKAFPDIVDYPNPDEVLPESMKGYDNRTLFWSLEFRGELRKKLLEYAFERDLMHPEDCGTMTHWYSRTPFQFLHSVKPSLLSQSTYWYDEATALVWDIREEENLRKYFRLTEAHIHSYGRPDLFHTIGLAERMMYEDRQENLNLKLYAYRKITQFLKQRYPHAPLLLSSWDLCLFWQGDEVKKLISELDSEQTIIFDYTSEMNSDEDSSPMTSQFDNWGVIGNFPWIFGIFHAYERHSEIRGDYPRIHERLKTAAEDMQCKGMVFWPEISHSDTLMLEYFALSSWKPCKFSPEEFVAQFCTKRYGEFAPMMTKLWTEFFKVIKQKAHCLKIPGGSGTDTIGVDHSYHYNILSTKHLVEKDARVSEYWDRLLREYEGLEKTYENVLRLLKSFSKEQFSNEFIKRDAFDIARTVAAQLLHREIMHLGKTVNKWLERKGESEKIIKQYEYCLSLMRFDAQLLGLHSDYSMNNTMEHLKATTHINPHFEEVLKDNASCDYCRQDVFELAQYLYLPEMVAFGNWLKCRISGCEIQDLTKEKNRIADEFMAKPLSEMKPIAEVDWTSTIDGILKVLTSD